VPVGGAVLQVIEHVAFLDEHVKQNALLGVPDRIPNMAAYRYDPKESGHNTFEATTPIGITWMLQTETK
jgi:hypothetical protein